MPNPAKAHLESAQQYRCNRIHAAMMMKLELQAKDTIPFPPKNGECKNCKPKNSELQKNSESQYNAHKNTQTERAKGEYRAKPKGEYRAKSITNTNSSIYKIHLYRVKFCIYLKINQLQPLLVCFTLFHQQ